jgi:hypothetical protein
VVLTIHRILNCLVDTIKQRSLKSLSTVLNPSPALLVIKVIALGLARVTGSAAVKASSDHSRNSSIYRKSAVLPRGASLVAAAISYLAPLSKL